MNTPLNEVINTDALRVAINTYLSKTFDGLVAAFPEEVFFYFGLYTSSDVLGWLADSAGGWKIAEKLAQDLSRSESFSTWPTERLLSAAKWMCADYPYHCFGADRGYDSEVNELLAPWRKFLTEEHEDEEQSDRLSASLRLLIDEELARFKTSKNLDNVLVLLTGGDIDWRWCAESATRVNGEDFCRKHHPDIFLQF